MCVFAHVRCRKRWGSQVIILISESRNALSLSALALHGGWWWWWWWCHTSHFSSRPVHHKHAHLDSAFTPARAHEKTKDTRAACPSVFIHFKRGCLNECGEISPASWFSLTSTKKGQPRKKTALRPANNTRIDGLYKVCIYIKDILSAGCLRERLYDASRIKLTPVNRAPSIYVYTRETHQIYISRYSTGYLTIAFIGRRFLGKPRSRCSDHLRRYVFVLSAAFLYLLLYTHVYTHSKKRAYLHLNKSASVIGFVCVCLENRARYTRSKAKTRK